MSTESSYVRKADWAERHLMELSKRVLAFMASEPYEVTDPVEVKRGRRTARLVFTDQPDPDIPLIAGDVLYNLRTAFDYLVGSLVPLSLGFNLLGVVFGFLFVRLAAFRRDWVAGCRAAG